MACLGPEAAKRSMRPGSRQPFGHHASDARERGFDLRGVGPAALGIGRDQDWYIRLVVELGPDDRDIARGILAVVAGLVADLPACRQAAAQPVGAGLAAH